MTTPEPLANLGQQAQQYGISPDPSAMVNVTTTVNIPLGFSIDETSPTAPVFALQLPLTGITAHITVSDNDLNTAVNVGFMGAQVQHGTVQLDVQATVNASDSDGNGTLSLQELQQGTLALQAGSSLAVSLPVSAQLGSFSTAGTIAINAADLSGSNVPALHITGLTGWQDFTDIGPANVIGALDQLGGQLSQLGGQVFTGLVPFSPSLALGQVADLGQAFETEVTSNLASWNAILNQQELSFSTAQELASGLAQALGVSPSQINAAYSPTTHLLTFQLAFSYAAPCAVNGTANQSQPGRACQRPARRRATERGPNRKCRADVRGQPDSTGRGLCPDSDNAFGQSQRWGRCSDQRLHRR